MTQPTVIFHGEDAGDSYYFWQWISAGEPAPKIHVVDRAILGPLLAELTESLPSPFAAPEGATALEIAAAQKAMMNRVLCEGVFSNYEKELEFSRRLGAAVLPETLAREIVDTSRISGERVLLRVLPAPSSARVPWELLPVMDGDEEHRLVEYADIASDPPVGIYAGRANRPDEWTAEYAERPVVYLIDPETRVEGAILTLEQRKDFARAVGILESVPTVGDPITRKQLSTFLTLPARPSRLFYLGHVASSAEQPGATSMLLSDSQTTFGVARVISRGGKGVNRPFSAFDAVEGTLYSEERIAALAAPPESLDPDEVEWPTADKTQQSGAAIWPMPARVALMACNSGGDLGHPEPFGLVIAFLNAGAGLVTATRWTLPTDFAFRAQPELLPGDPQPLFDMALHIDRMHAGTNPVRGIAEWQRSQLQAWQHTANAPNVAHSPILWAAVTTYLGPPKEPVELSPEELDYLTGVSPA